MEKLNNREKPEEKRELASESPEKIGEKNPSEFALAAADEVERKESDFLEQTETITKENPNLSEEPLLGLKEVFDMARQIANSTKEEILKLAESQTPLPIKPGEIFNAEEEFKKIEHLSPEERTKKMEEFNEKLSFQKLGLALFQEELIKSIRQNPEASFEELWKVAKNYASKFGFDYGELTKDGIGWSMKEGILGDIKFLINDYLLMREMGASIRKEYQSGEELFEGAFGRPPKGKIEVMWGLITVCFRCYDVDDYLLVIYGGRTLTPELVKEANSQTGCFTHRKLLVPLSFSNVDIGSGPYLMAINNTGDIFEDEKKSKIIFPMAYIHEEEHAIHYFIKRIFRGREKGFFMKMAKPMRDFEAVSKELLSSETDEERFSVLVEYFRQERKIEAGEEMAKNEIFSYIKAGTPVDIIYEALSQSADEEGLYDHFEFLKKRILENSEKILGKEYQSIVESAIKKVFIEEYNRLIKDGLGSFIKLTEAGFSRDVIIALFQKEPLEKWPKLVKRLSEIKK